MEVMKNTQVSEQVYMLVAKIPKGKVLTYGKIAKILGLKTPRQVGWILHRNEDPQNVPCHRVIFSDGSVSGNYAFGGAEAQLKWLLSEGVALTTAGKVNLKLCLWNPD
jgi:methylated-DNA-protein-cysteine methyltransferase related protein